MPQFTHRFVVQAALEDVAGFHHDSRVLKRLTPPPVVVQMHHVEPLKNDLLADFTMWLGPVPVRWLALHQNVDFEHGFTDIQVRGPFSSWVHRHSFHQLDAATTEVIDQVEAEFGAHWFWGMVSRVMWLNLKTLFAYRAWATRRGVAHGRAARLRRLA